jgi:hypothetical protein
MKKFLLITVALVASLANAQAQSPYQSQSRYDRIKCDVIDRDPPLNVRSLPDGKIVDGLPRGLSVIIGDRRGSWVYVEPEEGTGRSYQSGWVYSLLLGHCHAID